MTDFNTFHKQIAFLNSTKTHIFLEFWTLLPSELRKHANQ